MLTRLGIIYIRRQTWNDAKVVFLHILKDSIGGNCKTVMVAAIWPEPQFLQETLSTLNFAQRMGGVVNVTSVNIQLDINAQIKKYTKEIKELKETNSSKMNSQLHSEGSRPDSAQSKGSGVVRASRMFVNDIFEKSQKVVKESMNLYGNKSKPDTEKVLKYMRKKTKKKMIMKIYIIEVDILLVIFQEILKIKMQ